MLRNSFKFLSLALAASLTVAPISAIGWGNSNSSRWGLAGLGLAAASLVGVMVYNYCFSGKNTSVTNTSVTKEEKRRVCDILANAHMSRSEIDFVKEIIFKLAVSDRIEDHHFIASFKVLLGARKSFFQAAGNYNSISPVKQSKRLEKKLDDRPEVLLFKDNFLSLLAATRECI